MTFGAFRINTLSAGAAAPAIPPQDYWGATAVYSTGSNPITPSFIKVSKVDSSVYVMTYSEENYFGSNLGDIVISKFNKLGQHQWSRAIGTSAQQEQISIFNNSDSIDIDSSNNVYIGCYVSALTKQYLIKLSSDGSTLWQKEWATGGIDSVKVDSSDNVIINAYAEIKKYDPNGTLIWSKKVTSGNQFSLDNNNNIYIINQNYNAGNYQGSLIKCNSDMSQILWQTRLNGSGRQAQFRKLAVDSLGNTFVGTKGDSSNTVYIYKFNSEGTCLWSNSVAAGDYGGLFRTYDFDVINDGGIVVTFQDTSAITRVMVISSDGSVSRGSYVKYNTTSNPYFEANSCSIDSFGSIHFPARMYVTSQTLGIIKLPTHISTQGTFGIWTITTNESGISSEAIPSIDTPTNVLSTSNVYAASTSSLSIATITPTTTVTNFV